MSTKPRAVVFNPQGEILKELGSTEFIQPRYKSDDVLVANGNFYWNCASDIWHQRINNIWCLVHQNEVPANIRTVCLLLA